VRYADDFVIGFQHQVEAERCLKELHQRFGKFGLELHEEKTRLIEFGKFADVNRKQRGDSRPETFDFLGFMHVVARTRSQGRFTVHRYSSSKRLRATLKTISEKLRRRMHRPLGETGRWLRRVTQGWLIYHAVPFNSRQINRFIKVIVGWVRPRSPRSSRTRRPNFISLHRNFYKPPDCGGDAKQPML